MDAATVEIDLVRSHTHIFMNRRRNGQSEVNAQRVTTDRARQIYEANASNEDQRVIGLVDFGPVPCEWSWTTRIMVQ